MASRLQNVSTQDLYYICQMVDNVTRDPGNYIRHVDDNFGDAASASLVRPFPKYTSFHSFINAVISSVIWEQANNRNEVEVRGRGLWIDHLIEANDDHLERDDWDEVAAFRGSVEDYLVFLSEIGVVEQVTDLITDQVFHVLFSNRYTLKSFGKMISYYVTGVAPSFAPNAFTLQGKLRRVAFPQWARTAVFHRDKGRCVFCKTDLSKLLSIETKIHFDHIVPLAHGGMNCVTNLQLSCEACNVGKGARSASTSYEYEPWF
jgi:hypothetical protein